MVYDIAIIGAGVVGTQIARNFSKYDLKTVLLEKESDVAMGTTKANSGIVHAGFDCQSGTMMADLNVKGCRMMEEVATTLHVPYEKNGSLVVAFSEEEMEILREEIPADRIGSAKEAAEMILKILESPAYLTGQVITMDGGWM